MGGSTLKKTKLNFDPEFRFLLEIDATFSEWQVLASQWLRNQKSSSNKSSAISAFFVCYLHEQNLAKHPVAIFERSARLPDLGKTLKLVTGTENEYRRKNDIISDFLDWVLRTHLTKIDADGHRVVPDHLHNPFQRLKAKISSKSADIAFSHLLTIDPKMESWRLLVTEWLAEQTTGTSWKRRALDRFSVDYIINQNLERNPINFLKRTTQNPIYSDVIVAAKNKGDVGSLSAADITLNNYAADFLDWVLLEKLSIEDDFGYKFVPAHFHNPIPKVGYAGLAAPSETVRAALSIRYIKELRSMLVEGPNFRDWIWAQQAMEGGIRGGDWFVIDPKRIHRDDPDCVWRERKTSIYEQKKFGLQAVVTEMWSPVRAVALYIKLELPLRTFQVRMLDSGEADTWRYEHSVQGGRFSLNDSPLTIGSESRSYQRGVFHRSQNEAGAGLFINTNKTADINKSENAKGYVIPWTHEAVLYWLEKLRNWQERYNSINEPTLWRDLDRKHFGRTPPHPESLDARGTACFLFRDAVAKGNDRRKPLVSESLDRLWYLLLAKLEKRCIARGETLEDGTTIQFVNSDSSLATRYPLHSLRVSLISYLVLDLQLPLPVVSKLIAGHARIIMTLHYTKFGKAYMREVLAEAERKQLQADQQNHARFLMDATLEQVNQRFASLSVDAMRAAISQKGRASFVFEDKGICPVGGGMCDVGGEKVNESFHRGDYAPVPGYPQERNCVRCRFFLTGPAFLPGLQAHFNVLSYEAHERSELHNELHEKVTLMENRRAECELDRQIFTEARELERLSHHYEAEAEKVGKLINDMQATYHLIARSLEILKQTDKNGVQLVAVGALNDIEVAFTETSSELYQIEVLCKNAVIYPAIDYRKPTLRRSQLLDLMLEFNKMPPIFFRLNPKQQFEAGNAVMKLIQSRTGSFSGALEYLEGSRRLQELGIVDETWDTITEVVAGTPARHIIDDICGRTALPNKKKKAKRTDDES